MVADSCPTAAASLTKPAGECSPAGHCPVSFLGASASSTKTDGQGDGSITGGQPAAQVYDLGADGKDMKRVADVTNFAQAAERAAGGRDIFGGRSSADRKVRSTVPLSM